MTNARWVKHERSTSQWSYEKMKPTERLFAGCFEQIRSEDRVRARPLNSTVENTNFHGVTVIDSQRFGRAFARGGSALRAFVLVKRRILWKVAYFSCAALIFG